MDQNTPKPLTTQEHADLIFKQLMQIVERDTGQVLFIAGFLLLGITYVIKYISILPTHTMSSDEFIFSAVAGIVLIILGALARISAAFLALIEANKLQLPFFNKAQNDSSTQATPPTAQSS